MTKEDKARLFPVWEFYKGWTVLQAGKKRSGEPRTILCIETLRVMTEADAKALVRQYPQLGERGRKVTADKSELWPKGRRP